MSDFYWLTETQLEHIKPYLPSPRGRPRVDNLPISSNLASRLISPDA